MESVKRYIEEYLKLIANHEKRKIESPTCLRLLSFLMFQSNGTNHFIPMKQDKQNLKVY